MSSKIRLSRKKSARRPTPQDLTARVANAIQQHKEGKTEEASVLYRSILAEAPDQPDALHFLGVAEAQLGRTEEALVHISRALEIVPQHPDALNNRGNIPKGLRRLDEAERDYRQALTARPNDANTMNNLGTVLGQKGAFEEAETLFRNVIALQPDHAPALHNLGNLLGAQSRLGDAVEVYRRLLELFPSDPRARHLYAACSGQDVPARASDDCVRAEFDSFASDFDAKLARLEYRAPKLVEQEVARLLGQSMPALVVLDAGCGTGLCADFLRARARHLVGVDLSTKMIEQARSRSLYDALVVDELTNYLQQHLSTFDLIVSADTLVYFGDMADVLGASAKALRSGGTLVFTAERIGEADCSGGFRLNANGRYGHTHDYVARVLANASFVDPAFQAVELRKEAGAWVDGWLVSAKVD